MDSAQCTTSLKAKIAKSSEWPGIKEKSDCIGLLKIILNIAHNTEEQTNPTLSLIQATQRIYRLQQKENQSTEDYKIQFKNMLQVIESMKGHLYQEPMLDIIARKEYKTIYKLCKATEQADVREKAEQMARATLFIQNSHGRKSGQFKNKLYNDYLQGDKDAYPTDMNKANQLLKQYRSIPVPINHDNGNGQGSSFATKGKKQSNSDKESDSHNSTHSKLHPKWKNYTCKLCGQKGHPPYAKYCQVAKAIENYPDLQEYLKQKAAQSSRSNSSISSQSTQKNNRQSSKSRASRKSKSKSKSDTNKKAAIKSFNKHQKKQLKQQKQQFTQLMDYLNSSNSDSISGSSSDSGLQFAQFGGHSSDSSTSESDQFSDPPGTPWIDVVRK